jgi:hypothetical protein
MELATTTGTEQHDRVTTVSDINDRYPHDDADVIEIKQAMDNTSIALVPIDAANIMRVDDADADRDRVDAVAPNGAPAPSSASQALALMVMFDLDREPL